MEITQEQLRYISGELFDSSYTFVLQEKFEPKSRIESILEITRNKKIIHVGCVDHVGLIEEKIKTGTYVHKLLTENTQKCLGIDINQEGINLLKTKYNFSNVIYANLLTDHLESITSEKWDFILLGEILEHVDNPVEFLKTIKEKYKDSIEKIIITVPNVININLFRHAQRTKTEFINSDHKYWFTPYTVLRVMSQAGIIPTDLDFSGRVKLNPLELFKKRLSILLKKTPKYDFNYFNTLVATGKL